MDFVRGWIEKSGYSAALGVELAALSEDAATLRLPFREENANPGKALHGGCAASLGAIGGHAVVAAANSLGGLALPVPGWNVSEQGIASGGFINRNHFAASIRQWNQGQ